MIFTSHQFQIKERVYPAAVIQADSQEEACKILNEFFWTNYGINANPVTQNMLIEFNNPKETLRLLSHYSRVRWTF